MGLGVGCDGPSPSQGPGLPLMHCLCKVPVVASTAFLTCHSRSELVPSLTTEFSLQLPSTAAHPSVELWHKASGARVGTQFRLGHVLGQSGETDQSPRQFQSAFSTMFQELASVCMVFTSRV